MEYFVRQRKNNYPGFISIKEVSVAGDMKSAKVYLSVMNKTDCSQKVENLLLSERYFIQKALSNALKIKFCPRLSFFVNYVKI